MQKAKHPLDSVVYGKTFGDPKMAEIFSEENVQQARLDVENYLAKVQSKLKMIPTEAAEDIAENAKIEKVGLDNIAVHFEKTGNDIVSLVRALGNVCAGETRQWIHFGATSQDIHISGMAILLKRAIKLLDDYLKQLEISLLDLMQKNKNTLMCGRTHGQPALPITFGYKVAEWGYQIREHRIRLGQIKPRILVGSLKGAVGTQASFQGRGQEIEEQVMDILGLRVSPVNIQPSQERYIELVNFLSHIATTLARISKEIFVLHRAEFAEVEEAFKTGEQVSSSTMPHKRNPEVSETVLGMAYVIQGNANGMSRVLQENERDASRNAPEHLLIGESFIVLGKMVSFLAENIANLQVNQEAMERNIKAAGGFIMSEAVMFALASQTGRKEEAHHIVYECSMKAYEEKVPFERALTEDPRVKKYLGEEELQEIMDPQNYLGTAIDQVEKVVNLLKEKVDKT